MQQSHWPNPTDLSGPDVTGQRIFLDYHIPDNTVVFTVTSPYTCQHSNIVCAADPRVYPRVRYRSRTGDRKSRLTSLTCPFLAYVGSGVSLNDVVAGDYGDAINSAMNQAALSLGISAAAGAASGLRLRLSPAQAWPQPSRSSRRSAGIGVPPSATPASGTPSAPISACCRCLHCRIRPPRPPCRDSISSPRGARRRGTSASPSSRVRERRRESPVHPHARVHKMGALTDASAPVSSSSNGSPSITGTFGQPQINVQPNQVNPGEQLTVNGGWFPYFDPAHIHLVWTDTYEEQFGLSESDIDWGPSGGPLTHTSERRTPGDGLNFFDATDLSSTRPISSASVTATRSRAPSGATGCRQRRPRGEVTP